MESSALQNSRFLIVDDEPVNVSLLEQMLQQWDATHIATTNNPLETVTLFESFQPDVILLDLMMPVLDGYGVMEQLQPLISPSDFVPILILTADNSPSAKRRALELGAADFLTKPFDAVELSLRLNNLLARRQLNCQMRDHNALLEEQVQERTQQLARAELDTVACLAAAGEYRDDDTGQHTQRVGDMAARLAAVLGATEAEAEVIRRAAPLHDVGKIGISDLILLKPGRLTEEEFVTMKSHAQIGHSILLKHGTPLLQQAATIALTHHERWDGRGYPQGLAGEDIPLAGRIVSVVDVFDALTHERPYKAAWTVEEARAEIVKNGGTQFDPAVVAAFESLH